MNINNTKLTISKGPNLNIKQIEKPKSNPKDRGDAHKVDTVNVRKNDETKFKIKAKTNIDKSHNSTLCKSDKREVMETKDLRKDMKTQKEDKYKAPEEIIKNNKQKTISKALSNKETIKNSTETNKPQTESKSQKILRINIPNINEKKEKNKKNIRNVSKTDGKGSRNRTLSPILTKKASPSTEIAKWSSNKLAKPYYDAWVNAGIPKNMSMLEKNTRIQKQLKRYKSPELMYENYANEKFTGRIKVNYK